MTDFNCYVYPIKLTVLKIFSSTKDFNEFNEAGKQKLKTLVAKYPVSWADPKVRHSNTEESLLYFIRRNILF